MVQAVILATGSELLDGRTINTNAAFLSTSLKGLGIQVLKHVTCDDSEEAITRSLSENRDADLIITTGGLGPTDDDMTMDVIARWAGREVTVYKPAWEKMKKYFHERGMELHEDDTKMVSVPVGARVLDNNSGIAPGFLVQQNNQYIVSLPGVPGECELLFEEQVKPLLGDIFSIEMLEESVHYLSGIRESEVNGRLKNLDSSFRECQWGMTVRHGIVSLRTRVPAGLTSGKIRKALESEFGETLLLEGFTSPEYEIISLARERGFRISVTESCTGGLLAERLTSVPGASDVFIGGIVAYANNVKEDILNVPGKTLAGKGAVSKETALSMIEGLTSLLPANLAVSITGIAGPGGGSDQKPVGTVWIAFKLEDEITVREFRFPGNREFIRMLSVLTSLEKLRRHLRSRDSS